MDPNNSNQDQSQQTTPTQNDTPVDTASAQDQPTSDTPTDTASQDQPSDSTPPAEQTDQSTTPAQEVSDQTPPDPATQNDASAAAASTYIEDVGEDLIDLLDDIEADDNLIQVVANEMRLDKERVKATLSKLLDKIDQGQVTAEELALIMAAPVVDEEQEEQTPTEQAPADKSSETSNTQQ